MKNVLATFILATSLSVGLGTSTVTAASEATPAVTHPAVEGHVVFLYYKDIDSAARFYEDTVGLKKTVDETWVKFFQITPYSFVGLVDSARGYHKAAAPDTSVPVMLSMQTSDLEGWYKRLKAKHANFLKELDLDHDSGKPSLVNSILVKDPGGYTVEWFRWKQQ